MAKEPACRYRFDLFVPEDKLDEVKFGTAKGIRGLKFDHRKGAEPGTVDRETLRGVRKITDDTAALFDDLLGFPSVDEGGA